MPSVHLLSTFAVMYACITAKLDCDVLKIILTKKRMLIQDDDDWQYALSTVVAPDFDLALTIHPKPQ